MMWILGLGVVAYMVYKIVAFRQKVKEVEHLELNEMTERNHDIITIEQTDTSCRRFKNGEFDFHPKGFHYHIIRQDSIQKEINLITNDTSLFRIKWLDECVYTAKDLRGEHSRTIYMQILQTTPHYYIFKASAGSINDEYFKVDTMWVKK